MKDLNKILEKNGMTLERYKEIVLRNIDDMTNLPPEVMDSVVVHELCHRRHMNHSREFYDEVLRIFPDYKRCGACDTGV